MEMSKTECKRVLRTLELKAYRSVVDALRAQGTFTNNKHEVLKNLAATLSISEERYRSELRRAANDDLLSTIAQSITGRNTEIEWRTESMKKIPLTPMIASQTAFTALADTISDIVALENEKFSNSAELIDALESYKCRSEKNLEKYNSSKVLDSLLQKRKNNNQDVIFSELEKIKLNNNYRPPPMKSGYIEVSYDEDTNTSDTPVQSVIQKSVSWKSNDDIFQIEDDLPRKSTSHKLSQKSAAKSQTKFDNTETLDSQPVEKNPKQKLKSKKKNIEKPVIENKKLPSTPEPQIISETRNLRLKPPKKYTLNSVEIRPFEEVVPIEEPPKQKVNRNKSTNDVNKNVQKPQPSRESSANDSRIEISFNEKPANKPKSRSSKTSKRRGKGRAKPVRQSKLVKVRKLASSQRMKPDTAKEPPMRISRISMRNARRRNYARMASGDYDLSEFRKVKKEKKVEVEVEEVEKKEEIVEEEEEEEEIKESDPESHSDSSNAPIEVSYTNPAPPTSSNYELDGVSTHYAEDDMKPHTFNLIPASRRLKMLKKRATSPTPEEVPSKKIALSPPSKINQNSVSNKSNSNDINALRKVLAAHENLGNISSCNITDLPENVKELLNLSDRPQYSAPSSQETVELKSSTAATPIPPRSGPEKRPAKPKMKLSEASSIEKLHSLLSKVKEGDLKRLSKDSIEKKAAMNRKEPTNKVTNKMPPRITPTIETKRSETLIEVSNLENGSDSSSFSNENYDDSSKDSDSEDQIAINNEEITSNDSKQTNEKSVSLSSGEEVVDIILDDDDVTEVEASEQLIDIESADIIISDTGDQNDDFILAENNDSVIASEPCDDTNTKTFENVRLLEPTTVKISNNDEKTSKNDIIIVNMEKKEDVQLENYLDSLNEKEKDPIPKSSNHVKLQTNVKQILTAASDFRYIADVDDPSLKKPPVPLLPKNSFIIPKTSMSTTVNTINGSAKFTTLRNAAPIILNNLNNLEALTNPPKSSQNNVEIISNDSLNSKNNRQFVVLDANTTVGSKSLLKAVKTLPKIVPANNCVKSVNNVNQKPKKLAIYSSLKNINMATISSFPKNTPLKTTGVITLLKTIDSSNADITVKKDGEAVNPKSGDEKDPKRIVLSQALQSSLKSLETTKNNDKPVAPATVSELELTSSYDKMIEISSDSPPGDIISNDNDDENSSVTGINELKTFFSKNITRKQT